MTSTLFNQIFTKDLINTTQFDPYFFRTFTQPYIQHNDISTENINIQNQYGLKNTIITHAILYNSNDNIIYNILDYNPDLSILNANNDSALSIYLKTENRNIYILEKILNNIKQNNNSHILNLNNPEPLLLAIQHNYDDNFLNLLTMSGARINEDDLFYEIFTFFYKFRAYIHFHTRDDVNLYMTKINQLRFLFNSLSITHINKLYTLYNVGIFLAITETYNEMTKYMRQQQFTNHDKNFIIDDFTSLISILLKNKADVNIYIKSSCYNNNKNHVFKNPLYLICEYTNNLKLVKLLLNNDVIINNELLNEIKKIKNINKNIIHEINMSIINNKLLIHN